jgi:homogentisate 1,2-dioxygenase
MSGHGPDADTFKKASNCELKPQKLKSTLAFMMETRLPFKVSNWARSGSGLKQKNYSDCWQGL